MDRGGLSTGLWVLFSVTAWILIGVVFHTYFWKNWKEKVVAPSEHVCLTHCPNWVTQTLNFAIIGCGGVCVCVCIWVYVSVHACVYVHRLERSSTWSPVHRQVCCTADQSISSLFLHPSAMTSRLGCHYAACVIQCLCDMSVAVFLLATSHHHFVLPFTLQAWARRTTPN